MSTNLDLVRSIFADSERGDFERVFQSASEWAHPQIEYVIADGPEPGSWSGLAGMAEAWRGLLSAWKDLRVLAEEYRELDDSACSCSIVSAGRAGLADLTSERYERRERNCSKSGEAK